MSEAEVELRPLRPVPLWWMLLRDFLMLAVGLVGICYEHLSAGDPRPILVITDLVLIGLIPLQHVAPRVVFTAGRRAERS
jgi:hypothetical protein